MWQLLKKFIGQRKTPQRSAEKKYHILYNKIHGGYFEKDANYLSAKKYHDPKTVFFSYFVFLQFFVVFFKNNIYKKIFLFIVLWFVYAIHIF